MAPAGACDGARVAPAERDELIDSASYCVSYWLTEPFAVTVMA
jgi:hypothetical protein